MLIMSAILICMACTGCGADKKCVKDSPETAQTTSGSSSTN